MKIIKLKNMFCILLSSFILLTASACSLIHEPTPQPTIPLRYDRPEDQRPEGQPVGKFVSEVYFVSNEQKNLIPEEKTIEISEGENRAEAAVKAMLEGPSQPSVLKPAIKQGVKLIGTEISKNVANIDLDYENLSVDSREWLITRLAIANTVIAAEPGIEYVNVTMNGFEPGYYQKPLGPAQRYEGNLDMYIEQMQQEYGQTGNSEQRLATLYFTDNTGKMLLAEVRTIPIEQSEYESPFYQTRYIKAVIEELIKGPATSTGLQPVLPYDLRLNKEPELSTETYSGIFMRETVTLNFNEPAQSFNEKLVCAAITSTVCGFYPEIECVRILFNGREANFDGISASPRMFKKSDFADMLGNIISIDVPDLEDRALSKENTAVLQSKTYDLKFRLDTLLAALHTEYISFTSADIKKVYSYDDMIVVDWNKGFIAKLGELLKNDQNESRLNTSESLFIYSIINTLTEIPGMNRVWFLEDGSRILEGSQLYLGNSLLRSPGIILEE